MKYLTFIFILVSTWAYSQDIIYMVNGEIIHSKVSKVSIDEISFHKTNNLTGPIYNISKKEVAKIVFENGEEESFNEEPYNKESKEIDISLEGTKSTILKYINNHAYTYLSENKYKATFEGDYIRFVKINEKTGKEFSTPQIYDFSGKCVFHRLSYRGTSVGLINVYVRKVYKKKNNNYKIGVEGKLVIRIKGGDNAKTLLDALIRYNEFFVE